MELGERRGFLVNTVAMTFQIPGKKEKKTVAKLGIIVSIII